MLKQLIISSLAFAAVAAAPSAYAQDASLPSVKVSFNGIDTRSEAGAQIMLRRIKLAAGQVCGGEPSIALDRQMKFQPCVEQVTQRTVDGLNNSKLAAAWNKETGAPAATQVARSH
jgi:UrcA family protein